MKGTAGHSAFAYLRNRERTGKRKRHAVSYSASHKTKCDQYTDSVLSLQAAHWQYRKGKRSKKWQRALGMAQAKKAWYCGDRKGPKPSNKGTKKRPIMVG